MTRPELEGYLNVGRGRSAPVAVEIVPEFPAYVRTITIRAGNEVTVEFQPHGSDEGGPIFNAAYGSLDEAIAAVESYLGRPLEAWTNPASQTYPEEPCSCAENSEVTDWRGRERSGRRRQEALVLRFPDLLTPEGTHWVWFAEGGDSSSTPVVIDFRS